MFGYTGGSKQPWLVVLIQKRADKDNQLTGDKDALRYKPSGHML